MTISDAKRAFFLKELSLTSSKLSTNKLASIYYKTKLGVI